MLNKKIFLFCILAFLCNALLMAQNVIIEGYAFEDNNRGYLNLVSITVTEKSTNTVVNRADTDIDGFFQVQIPVDKDYVISAKKDIFQEEKLEVSTKGMTPDTKKYVKIKMNRADGYLFDVTLAEKWDGQSQVDAIQGALIEIYNNTTDEEELILKDHPVPYFKFTFQKGNHYTVMVRKKGYFTKRMEAYVDVDGCILCFDGLDEISPAAPGASDNLTAGHNMGTIVSNVELLPIKVNETITLNKIYYDLGKWNIRDDAAEQLNKLIETLESNPSLLVELGSHTDSRGSAPSNKELSQKRAQSAVNYIVKMGDIDKSRITAKGYGESKIINECKDGVKCSDHRHQLNRRTELKITGVTEEDPWDNKSLAAIIKEEKFDEMLAELQNQEVVQVQAGEELPEHIRRQMAGEAPMDEEISESKSNNTTTETSYTDPLTGEVYTPTAATTGEAVVEQAQTAIRKGETATRPDKEEILEEIPTTTNNNTTETVVANTENVILDTAPVVETKPDAPISESTGKAKKEYEVKTNSVTRPPKALTSDYTGFKIEFFTSISELPLSHEIFSRHGNITMEQTKSGRYAYLLGDFKNRSSAIGFLKDIMIPQYRTARVVKYIKGRRSK